VLEREAVLAPSQGDRVTQKGARPPGAQGAILGRENVGT
jgi:hypothetical protein